MERYVLLTGATGLVGQYLLRDFLRKNIPVAVLIRSRGDERAHQRMERVVGHWEKEQGSYLPRPICIEGDLTSEGMALDNESRRWIAKHCDRVLHNAASLTFDGADRNGEPWLSNLTGTQNVLELSREAGIRQWHYMSTAYVCGRRPGPVYESELDCGQEFRNEYEQSKLEAEQAVRSASFLDSLTVYRPAIIVGDSKTGYTSSYHALYLYLQLIFMLDRFLDTPRDENGCRHIELRLDLTGEERRNLVPVDWVAAVTTYLFENVKCHGQTYNLTPREPITVKQIEAACEHYFNFCGVTFEGPGKTTPEQRNDLEKLFYEQLSTYSSYWDSEPIFDSTNTCQMAPHLPCPVLDEPILHRLTDYAIQDRWGNRRKRPSELPFDVAMMLEDASAESPAIRATDRLLVVGLDLWGPGGGQWHVQVDRNRPWDLEVGLAKECDVVYRSDVGTFVALVRGEVSARHAIRQGLVEVVPSGDKLSDPAELLDLFANRPGELAPQQPHNKQASRQTV